MTNLSSAGALAGRVLLAFMFILAGWAKLGDIPGNMAYTASGGLPGFFVFPAIAIELLGGLAVLVGWQTRWAALALALFAVVAAIFYHYLPAQGLEGMERMGQILNFQKNLAIAGGFLAPRRLRPGPLLPRRALRPAAGGGLIPDTSTGRPNPIRARPASRACNPRGS